MRKLARRDKGPVTARRQRMTWGAYAFVVALGALPWLLGLGPALKAFGLGLWAPGAGFLAVGGWPLLLMPVTLVLFAAAVFAWFGAGALLFPLVVWLGSAALAAMLAGPAIWGASPVAAFVLIAAGLACQAWRIRRRRSVLTALRATREALLPQALAEVEARARPRPADSERELTPEMLAGVRYLLDRALQPLDKFNGFDRVDIFQTASVRYQINFIGYALSILQARYLPSFHGYLSQAQRNLIEKYLNRKIWSYWVYESIWGHFNVTNWDPAAKDNIMLTGYYGTQVNLYMRVSGDRRYADPGSLTFRLNRRVSYPHDAHSINQSLVDNFNRSAYCLYPCEPNWIYPACNFRGMISLVSYDSLFGTDHAASIQERFLDSVDQEFTDESGSIVALRSSLTGMPFPFPGSDMSFAPMANVFAPDRARRLWAVVQHGLRRALISPEGTPLLALPNKGIDFGNYRRGVRTMAAASIMQIAREFGDEELATAAYNTLEAHGGKSLVEGVLSYANGSNLANIYAMQGLFARADDIRDTVISGPDPRALKGPVLDDVPYPSVLVASAHSDGDDLRLIVYSTGDRSPQRLGLARLVAGRRYEIEGRPETSFVADAEGRGSLRLALDGRTQVRIRPVD